MGSGCDSSSPRAPFDVALLCRLLRELKLLRYCRGHENFIIIKDIILSPPGKDFKDIYIVRDASP